MDSTNAYVYGPSGTPFEQVNLSTGAITYLVADALGSVRGVVGATGSLSASTSYDAWGNPETTGGLSADTPFGFAGGYTDPSGLVYLIGRYYDPATGQFLSVDPLVDETGQPYAYTGDDPVNALDPSGAAASPLPVNLGSITAADCSGAVQQIARGNLSGAASLSAGVLASTGINCGIGGSRSVSSLLASASTALGYVQVVADVVAVGCAFYLLYPCTLAALAVSEVSGLGATGSACLSSVLGGPASATDACTLSLQTASYTGGFVSGPALEALLDIVNWLVQGGGAGAAEPPCGIGNVR